MNKVSDHLSIRFLSEDDSDFVKKIWTNPDVRAYLGGIVSDEEAMRRFDQMLNEQNRIAWHYVVESAMEKTGIVSLDLHHKRESYELSYQFLPEYWGKGLAHTALTQILNDIRARLNLDRVVAETQEKNVASNKLLIKLGMKETDRCLRFNERQVLYELHFK